jgi:hypothetical protein
VSRKELAIMELDAATVDELSNALCPPVMTRKAFAAAIGLPLGVLVAQAERGYWPEIKRGKRKFINVEAVRQEALRHAAQAKA